jgi:hypothetical protein
MNLAFDGFVAVDWSGAKGDSYSGIAVAICDEGDSAPRLVPPPGRRWRRSDFVEWLVVTAGGGERLLVAIDCAFALPVATAGAILGPAYTAHDLWMHIDCLCAEAGDFYGGGFAEHEAHAPLFWAAGPRPAAFAEHRRATELACRKAGLGAPESPLKLVGARQVGKGGLAGMRVLAALKRRLENDLCVWPFDSLGEAQIVCAELYPRLFMRAVGHGSTKVRTIAELERCLAALGSKTCVDAAGPFSDHETDALVAAAGLRKIAGDRPVWTPSGLDSLARRAEGWILGVP